jgi:hypothetical protein
MRRFLVRSVFIAQFRVMKENNRTTTSSISTTSNSKKSHNQQVDYSSDSDSDSSEDIGSPPFKTSRRRLSGAGICKEAQVVLLQSILSPQGDRTYSTLLDHRPNWFGERKSKLRKSVHSR